MQSSLQNQKGFAKLNGFYRGKVIQHLSRGYCKIWIPDIYSDEWRDKPDMLPPAEQASSLFAGANNGNGVFTYPNIGTSVWCFFANGDQNLPVYFATTLGGEEANANWDSARAMPGSHPDDAYVHKLHFKNSDIEVYETGMVKVHTENKENKCDLTLDASGNAILETTSTIVLKSKNIKLDASTQVDIIAPNLKSTNEIAANIASPAISLNSVAGHTTIISKSGTTTL